eukprot:c6119_g1_i1.p1 GENE.c6119_g1_i1~~c6119_g1_i1.p1  ORF type:complete len:114 (+),score=31.85 c6119_g1_i1:66-407(+)
MADGVAFQILGEQASDEYKQTLPQIALEVYQQKKNNLVEVASTLQKKLNEEKAEEGEVWNVVMGKSFGLSIAFAAGSYLYLRFFEQDGAGEGKTLFCLLLFKSAQRLKKPDEE